MNEENEWNQMVETDVVEEPVKKEKIVERKLCKAKKKRKFAKKLWKHCKR